MRKIKINFADFWKSHNPENNFFTNMLRERFDVIISSQPDVLIYSNYGKNHLRYTCTKVFFNCENIRPDYNLCDYSFSFEHGGEPKNYRLPLYVIYQDVRKLTAPKDIDSIVKSKTRFCNFIYSNPRAQERIRFFELLSRYKKVDSIGKVLRNTDYEIGRTAEEKRAVQSHYKFTIAFENSSYPGYTTEKIFEPMLVNSIPVYWGNPDVGQEFNEKSFVNVHKYASYEEVIEQIIKIDQDEDLYRQYLAADYFNGGEVPQNLRSENILNQFELIFDSLGKSIPVARTFMGQVAKYSTIMNPYLKKVKRITKQKFK